MTEPAPATWKLLLAFALVYVIWGSTYIAILFAIETLPPFLMAAARFLAAGAVLYAWCRWREDGAAPTLQQWRSAAIVGVLLLTLGNGLVSWSETRVPTGVAALLVAMVPCWMVLIDWMHPRGTRPGLQVIAGLVLGLAGVAWLVGGKPAPGARGVDLLGAGALLVSTLAWASGSVYARHAVLPRSPLLATGMQMLAGGAVLVLIGGALGEFGRIDAGNISFRSVAALLYLAVFGSIVAFTAYVWLLRVSAPAKVSTYAYVNPVIAVFLGWALADEALTTQMLLAAAVIIGGVAMITLAPKPVPSTPASSSAPGSSAEPRKAA